ncbi:hypothetical protein [Rhodoligotrophos defluvii]|uniref:hypothetical protein n=1 Tax=Rhodoligotrophos defluvii TaxID=2561934 RepID=UPI0010C9C220|nr:hypothetical protein [Rhodoligotrophos defluvii]
MAGLTELWSGLSDYFESDSWAEAKARYQQMKWISQMQQRLADAHGINASKSLFEHGSNIDLFHSTSYSPWTHEAAPHFSSVSTFDHHVAPSIEASVLDSKVFTIF